MAPKRFKHRPGRMALGKVAFLGALGFVSSERPAQTAMSLSVVGRMIRMTRERRSRKPQMRDWDRIGAACQILGAGFRGGVFVPEWSPNSKRLEDTPHKRAVRSESGIMWASDADV